MTNNTESPGEMQAFKLYDDASAELHEVEGELLGFASSQSKHHNVSGHYAPASSHRACKACRWFEVRIIRVAPGDYIVSYDGCTVVPGETQRHTVIRTSSPYTVIESLTQQRNGEAPFIPKPSRMALSEAAARDAGIEQAWIDRALD